MVKISQREFIRVNCSWNSIKLVRLKKVCRQKARRRKCQPGKGSRQIGARSQKLLHRHISRDLLARKRGIHRHGLLPSELTSIFKMPVLSWLAPSKLRSYRMAFSVRSLEKANRRRKSENKEPTWDDETIKKWANQLMQVLSVMKEKNIIHNDIKPAWVFVDCFVWLQAWMAFWHGFLSLSLPETSWSPLTTRFWLLTSARLKLWTKYNSMSTRAKTVAYAAPERLRLAPYSCFASDTW